MPNKPFVVHFVHPTGRTKTIGYNNFLESKDAADREVQFFRAVSAEVFDINDNTVYVAGMVE